MSHSRPPARNRATADTGEFRSSGGLSVFAGTAGTGARRRSERRSVAEASEREPERTELVTSTFVQRDNCADLLTAGQSEFPTVADVEAAGAALAGYKHLRGERLRSAVVTPGAIRLTAPWPASGRDDAETKQREARARLDQSKRDEPLTLDAVLDGPEGHDDGDSETGDSKSARGIGGWSRRSRALMTLRLAELDYSAMLSQGRPAAMLTLTYPGDWKTAAPTGKECKRHFEVFLLRYKRAWGESLACVWKLEFQRRGAPHYHLFLVPPEGRAGESRQVAYEAKLLAWEAAGKVGRKPRRPGEAVGDGLDFRRWARAVWADVVDHPDLWERMKHESAGASVDRPTTLDYAEGMRSSDPKRLAVYFSKHGRFEAKEYQHEVPELWQKTPEAAPGRFWGYRGLKPLRSLAELDQDDYETASRVLRRYARRQKFWNGQSHEWRKPVMKVSVPRRRVDLFTGLHEPEFDDRGAVVFDEDGEPVPRLRYRKATKPVKRFKGNYGAGFLIVNDGPALAGELARYLAGRRGDGARVPGVPSPELRSKLAALRKRKGLPPLPELVVEPRSHAEPCSGAR